MTLMKQKKDPLKQLCLVRLLEQKVKNYQDKNNINMVTVDVGGTSFDTCLILDGRPQIQFEGKIVGLPVQSPWVDVRSIG